MILTECLRVLRVHGRIMILQPNINYLGGKYWDFFDHYTPLNEKSMKEVLELCQRESDKDGKIQQFVVRKIIRKFLPYTTKSRIPQQEWMIKLYCHCPIIWTFMGKQTFIISEKVRVSDRNRNTGL